MNSKILTILSAGALALGGVASGQERDGRFQAAEVAGDAKWFVHVDLAALRGSEIGKEMLSRIDGDAQRKINAFKRMISFNPVEDLDAVTLFGTDAGPEKAVALLRGVFDVEHLTDLVKAADAYKSGEHAGSTVHSWADGKTPGGRLFGCMVSDKRMVLGPDRGLVHRAIDLAKGDGESLEGGTAFAAAFDGGGQRPIVAAAADLAGLGGLEIESAFVRRVRSIYLAAGEADGEVFARAVVGAEDERAPQLMGMMLSGVLAFGEVSDQLPEGTASAVEVEASGKELHVDAAMGLDDFLELVEGLEELKGNL